MQVRIDTKGTATVTLTLTEKRKLQMAITLLTAVVQHGDDAQSDKADEALKALNATLLLLEPLPLIDKTPAADAPVAPVKKGGAK